jgi:hypothetical protein
MEIADGVEEGEADVRRRRKNSAAKATVNGR